MSEIISIKIIEQWNSDLHSKIFLVRTKKLQDHVSKKIIETIFFH